MLFKKSLTSLSFLLILITVLVSQTRVILFATTTFLETNFLSNSIWVDASGQTVVGNTTTGSPYTVTTNDKEFTFSVGSNDTGSSRILFGATQKTVADEYANLDHPALSSFLPLSLNHSFEGVIAMNQPLYYQRLTSFTFSWGTNSSNDSYSYRVIVSEDEGQSWSVLENSTLSPGSSPGSKTNTFSWDTMSIQVGLLLTNNVNTNSIYIVNPELSMTFESLTDAEQATLFANEIDPYSPCADELNGMTQLTEEKQTELLNLYTQLSESGKAYLHTIPMGDGFSAYDRYVYLMKPL
jgi:hypothetical protein